MVFISIMQLLQDSGVNSLNIDRLKQIDVLVRVCCSFVVVKVCMVQFSMVVVVLCVMVMFFGMLVELDVQIRWLSLVVWCVMVGILVGVCVRSLVVVMFMIVGMYVVSVVFVLGVVSRRVGVVLWVMYCNCLIGQFGFIGMQVVLVCRMVSNVIIRLVLCCMYIVIWLLLLMLCLWSWWVRCDMVVFNCLYDICMFVVLMVIIVGVSWVWCCMCMFIDIGVVGSVLILVMFCSQLWFIGFSYVVVLWVCFGYVSMVLSMVW